MANRHIKNAQSHKSLRKCKSKSQWDTTWYLPEWLLSRRQQIKMFSSMWRKRTLRHHWWRCKLIQSLWKTVQNSFKKLKIELPYDPAISLLDIYLMKIKILISKYIWTPMFTAWFTIARTWKQLKYIYINGYTNTHTHAMEDYSAFKKMKSCHLWQLE